MPPRVVWSVRAALSYLRQAASLAGALAVAASLVSAEASAAEVVSSLPADGSLSLVDAGQTVTKLAPETSPLRRGTPRVRQQEVQHHLVFEVRLPVRGTESEEVWLGEATEGHVKASGNREPKSWTLLWHGIDGPQDADAESAVHVDLTPQAIWRYQTSPAVTRCDDAEARLFPEAWDFAGRRFRSVVSPLPTPSHQSLVAQLAPADMPTGRPRGGFRWTAASTTATAGSDARNLLAPRELNDEDPHTVWSEGLGGDGRGEFLTARTNGGRLAVTGVRVVLGHADDPAAFRKENRVRRLQLLLGPGEARRFDVTLPEAPASKGPLPAYWVPLPSGLETECLTVVLAEIVDGGRTAGAERRGGTTSLAAIDVFTEVDGPDGTRRLVERLVRAQTACELTVSLVVAEGQPALAPLAEELARAQGPVRTCLLEALARIPGHGSDALAKDALMASVLGASLADERWLGRAFEESPESVVPGLSSLLLREDVSVADRARAARLLGGLNYQPARSSLLAAVGLSNAQLRTAVVAAVSASKGLTLAEVATAFANPQASPAARADLLRVLIPLLDQNPGSAEALAWLGTLVQTATLPPSMPSSTPSSVPSSVPRSTPPSAPGVFELRGRAIAALGHLEAATSTDALSQLLAHDPDPVIRYFAVRELVHRGGASLPTLRLALADGDPRVRETAAEGLGLLHDVAAADALAAAAKDEGWPFARRAEVAALARLCVSSSFYLMERAVDRDSNDIARAALQGLARCHDPRVHDLLWRKLRSAEAPPNLREQAATLLGRAPSEPVLGASSAANDPDAKTDAYQLAELVPSLVKQAERDDAVAGVVEAVVRTLATLGGSDAVGVIQALANDRRHPYGAVALEAMGHLCDPTSLLWLRAKAAQPTDALAEAATRALRRCNAATVANPPRAP